MKSSFLKLVELYIKKFPFDRKFILDIGCGNGDVVYELKQNGYQSKGIDIRFKKGNNTKELVADGCLKLINVGDVSRENLGKAEIYTWPNFENQFDLMLSIAVIEHVPDMKTFCFESYKQIKDNGVILHYFPSRWALIEPHTGIPFGGIFQSKLYYYCCCYSSLCFRRYRREPLRALEYMTTYTFYRDLSKLKQIYFENNLSLEEITQEMLLLSSNKVLRKIARFRIIVVLFSIFRSKVILVRSIN